MSDGAEPGREYKRWSNLVTLWRRMRPTVGATAADVVHRENKWTLLRYRPRAEGVKYKTPLLLVPSIINRHYVLDLQPGKSFVEYFVAQGFDVYLLHWGTPGPEDRYLTFDEICDAYLGRALRHVSRTSERDKAHVLGYCVGGTFTAIHAAVRPEHFASLTVLAAPVRFRDEGMLSTWAGNAAFEPGALVEAFGNAPWPLLQTTFQMLKPTLSLSKWVGLFDRAWDDEFVDSFFALETWINDNVSLPGEAFRRFIDEMYRGDALVKGTFTLSGRPVHLHAITCPTLAVTFEHDHIVPWQSAAVLLDHIASTDKERLHLNGGHVGSVVSRKAAQSLWPKLAAWWAARDAEPVPAVQEPEAQPERVAVPRVVEAIPLTSAGAVKDGGRKRRAAAKR